MFLRLTTNLGYPVDLFYLFIHVCCFDLQLIGLPGGFVLFIFSCMLLRLPTNLGYPIDLFYLFIHVCCYDLQVIGLPG